MHFLRKFFVIVQEYRTFAAENFKNYLNEKIFVD